MVLSRLNSKVLQPLSAAFVPTLQPALLERPSALPRPANLQAAPPIAWDTWRDTRTFRIKTKEEIKREVMGLDRGLLHVGVVVNMPFKGDDEGQKSGVWELGLLRAPWKSSDLYMDKGKQKAK